MTLAAPKKAKEAPAKRRKSGPTQPEGERTAKQKLLRLAPPHLATLARLAARWGVSESAAVARAVEEALSALR